MPRWLASNDATTTPLPDRPLPPLPPLLLVLDRPLDEGRELDAEEARRVLGVGVGSDPLASRPLTNLRAERTGVRSVSTEGATTTLLSTRRSCSRGTSQAFSPPPPTPAPSCAVSTFPGLPPPRAPLKSGRRTTDGRDAREVADDAGRSPPVPDHGIARGSPSPRRPRPERIVVAFEVVSSHLPSSMPQTRPTPFPLPVVRPMSPPRPPPPPPEGLPFPR